MSIFVLVQDIGLLSLRDLVSAKGVHLTAEQKFKLTKTLCMAVKDLHTECNVVHRDHCPHVRHRLRSLPQHQVLRYASVHRAEENHHAAPRSAEPVRRC